MRIEIDAEVEDFTVNSLSKALLKARQDTCVIGVSRSDFYKATVKFIDGDGRYHGTKRKVQFTLDL